MIDFLFLWCWLVCLVVVLLISGVISLAVVVITECWGRMRARKKRGGYGR